MSILIAIVIVLLFIYFIVLFLFFQARVEEAVLKFYRLYDEETDPILLRPKHIQFLKKSITHLSEAYEVCISYLISNKYDFALDLLSI